MGTKKRSLTKRQKAVLVAKDVLKQLKRGYFRVNSNGYISSGYDIILQEPIKDWQEVIKEVIRLESRCTVCALGSLLFSKVRLFNDYPCDKARTEGTDWVYIIKDLEVNLTEQLNKIFDTETLKRIEFVFEFGMIGIFASAIREGSPAHSKLEAATCTFREKYDQDQAKILAAIMKNIIKNKGKFVLN